MPTYPLGDNTINDDQQPVRILLRNGGHYRLATRYVTRYNGSMICNIRHKGLAALFYEEQTRGVLQAHVKRLRMILALLDTGTVLEDMNAPGLRLHALKGDRAGFHAVVVSGNWRVIFRFSEATGDAFDVDYLDYH